MSEERARARERRQERKGSVRGREADRKVGSKERPCKQEVSARDTASISSSTAEAGCANKSRLEDSGEDVFGTLAHASFSVIPGNRLGPKPAFELKAARGVLEMVMLLFGALEPSPPLPQSVTPPPTPRFSSAAAASCDTSTGSACPHVTLCFANTTSLG